MNSREELRKIFEEKYLNTPNLRGGTILQEDIDDILAFAKTDGVEQEMLDYFKAHPDAIFWDFAKFLKPGLHGVTQEELLADDE